MFWHMEQLAFVRTKKRYRCIVRIASGKTVTERQINFKKQLKIHLATTT